MITEEKLLNIKEAARLLNVSEISLRRWTDSGRLPCLRIGPRRERRFRHDDLLAFGAAPPPSGADSGGTPPRDRHLYIEGLTVEQGSHLCALYETDQGRLKLSVPFLSDGLRAGARCILVADAAGTEHIVGELRTVRPAVDDDVDCGRLVLSDGQVTSAALYRFLEDMFVTAMRIDIRALRVMGDMAALLTKGMSLEALIEFETRYDRSLADRYPVLSLCQYDARRFPGVGILQALKCHRDTFRLPLARFLS